MQFSELGMGTTTLQDGSLPAPGAVLLARDSCSLVPPQGGGFSVTQGPPARRKEHLMGAEALY